MFKKALISASIFSFVRVSTPLIASFHQNHRDIFTFQLFSPISACGGGGGGGTPPAPPAEPSVQVPPSSGSYRCGLKGPRNRFGNDSKIFGGGYASNGEWPWMARLAHYGYSSNCVGPCSTYIINPMIQNLFRLAHSIIVIRYGVRRLHNFTQIHRDCGTLH